MIQRNTCFVNNFFEGRRSFCRPPALGPKPGAKALVAPHQIGIYPCTGDSFGDKAFNYIDMDKYDYGCGRCETSSISFRAAGWGKAGLPLQGTSRSRGPAAGMPLVPSVTAMAEGTRSR